MKKEIWQIKQPDLLEGLAGLLLGILAGESGVSNCQRRLAREPMPYDSHSTLAEASRTTNDPTPIPQGIARELALRCADRILQLPDPEESDAFTGNAGIGCALAKAYAFTGQEAYAAGAANAFAKVHDAYAQSQKGWLKSSKVMKWAAKRAPEAAGIGLCALEALKVLEMKSYQDQETLKVQEIQSNQDRKKSGQPTRIVPATPDSSESLTILIQTIQEVLNLAVESLLTEDRLYWNDSLYRGNALSVLFLARASAYLQKPELQEQASRILTSMERRRKASGYYHLMEPGVRSTFDISFLEGTLGIGYVAMELSSGSENSKGK